MLFVHEGIPGLIRCASQPVVSLFLIVIKNNCATNWYPWLPVCILCLDKEFLLQELCILNELMSKTKPLRTIFPLDCQRREEMKTEPSWICMDLFSPWCPSWRMNNEIEKIPVWPLPENMYLMRMWTSLFWKCMYPCFYDEGLSEIPIVFKMWISQSWMLQLNMKNISTSTELVARSGPIFSKFTPIESHLILINALRK